MTSTSVSLLRRLKEPSPDAAWQRFVELFAPLIFHWGRNQGLSATDAAGLAQEVLAILVSVLPERESDPNQPFRVWLRTVTVNKANDFHGRDSVRPRSRLEEAIPQVTVASDVDLFDVAHYRAYLVRRVRQQIEAEFEPQTWLACWKYVAEGRSAADVGRELGISANAVRVSKCRVFRRLREELDGLLD